MSRCAFAAAGILGLLALCAGCASPPLDVLEYESLKDLRAKASPPLDARVGVGVALDTEGWKTTRLGEDYEVKLRSDGGEILSGFSDPLRKLGLFQEVVALEETVSPDEPVETLLARGREAGLDYVVRLALKDNTVAYTGRNFWWIPNLIVWAVCWFPAWIIPDEDFEGRVDLHASVYHVPSGKLLAETSLAAAYETSVTDFDRTLYFWGILLVPYVLDEEDFEKVSEEVTPHALNRAKEKFLRAMFDLREGIRSGSVEVPKPEEPPPPVPVPPDGEKGGEKPPPDGEGPPPDGEGPGETPGPEPEPKPQPDPLPEPRNFALVVGVSGTEGTDLGAADAGRMAAWLRDGGRFEEGAIHLLTGKKATRRAVSAALGEIASDSKTEEDEILLYFAGRGAQVKNARGEKLVWVLADTRPDDPAGTGIFLGDVLDFLGTLGPRRVTVVMDTAFAEKGSGRSLGRFGGAAFDPAARLRAAAAERKGLAIFAAAGSDSAALEVGEIGGGLFTYFFLRGIAGPADADRNGTVTVGELGTYLRRHVDNTASLLGRVSLPVVAGAGETPVIGKKEKK
jgi:hypothetical protein